MSLSTPDRPRMRGSIINNTKENSMYVLIFGYNWPFRLNYLPPTKLWKGNVFTGVCNSVQVVGMLSPRSLGGRGWVCLIPHPLWGIPGLTSLSGVGMVWGWYTRMGQVYHRVRGWVY